MILYVDKYYHDCKTRTMEDIPGIGSENPITGFVLYLMVLPHFVRSHLGFPAGMGG